MKRIARLFIIKTRLEAWVVIYAIALGAVERGQHYLAQYPGAAGWLLAAACTGVVFLAGAKLLDSVKPRPALIAGPYRPKPARRKAISGNRPRGRRGRSGSGSRHWRRTGSRPTTRPLGRPAESPVDRTRSPDR